MKKKTLFITGTDTEVGKTFTSCALLAALKKNDTLCSAFKPVASGIESQIGIEANPDTLALQRYSGKIQSLDEVTPFFFREAIAPHLAARRAQTQLTIAAIHNHYQEHFDPKAFTLIEGAGGWEVPLNDKESFADLALSFGGAIILVVNIKLGCINHALLSAHRIRQQGGQLVAWVANNFTSYEFATENIEAIQERIALPLLATLPKLPSPDEGIAFVNSSLLESIIR